MSDYAKPDSIVSTDWVAEQPRRPQGPAPRGRRRHRRLRDRPRPRRRRPGTGRPTSRPTSCATSPTQRGSRSCSPGRRRRHRHHGRPLRRQQQLVRRLRPLAAQVLRPRQRQAHERRPQEVGRRGPRHRHRRAEAREGQHHRQGPQRRHPRPARRGPREPRQARTSRLVDVRSPKEFSGELLAPENLPQEGSQRGGHIPGAKNIPWGQAVNEDGTFKSARRARGALRRPGRHAGQGRHRLLPHRRALRPHLVRAHAPPRLRQRHATTTAPGPSGAPSSASPSRSSAPTHNPRKGPDASGPLRSSCDDALSTFRQAAPYYHRPPLPLDDALITYDAPRADRSAAKCPPSRAKPLPTAATCRTRTASPRRAPR